MKTKPRRFRDGGLPAACWIFILIAGLFASTSAHADGFFVAPKFVWDKHRDINEPTQKAIIAYNAGHEDLILQVKYDGPVEEFGWLIPVPNVPTVTEASMECFYELSKYTQKNFEPQGGSRMMMRSAGTSKGMEPEPPVKVIEIKTVGAYQIAVLSAKDAGPLESWLAANEFYLPADQGGVIDSYVKQGWYFVAVRINLNKVAGFQIISGTPKAGVSTKVNLEEKLSNGELRPLHLAFASDKCVFPLKISSLNGKPSEVQVYVLSKEPLVEKGMFEIKLAEHYRWRTNMLARRAESFKQMQAIQARFAGGISNLPPRPEPDDKLGNLSAVNEQELIPYGEVGRKELPVCSKEIILPDQERTWLTKQTWTFKPVEMRDLEFSPAVPVFTTYLQDGEGTFAAANLVRLGTNGASALLMATESANPVVRAHALAAMESVSAYSRHSELNRELVSRLPELLKDKNPEVRLHAIAVADDSEDPKFFDTALELLRDDNAEVSAAAVGYLRLQRAEASKRIPLFHQMLKDTNSSVQMAGIRLLLIVGVEIPREELLPLFSVPRMEVAGAAVGVLQREHVSCEEAKPLLQNSLWMVRLMGLKILAGNTNSQSVEFAIPLLRDDEQVIRARARDMLADLTGQNFPVEQPDRWEKWWAENKSTFVLDEEQVRQRRAGRMQQRRDSLTRQRATGMQ